MVNDLKDFTARFRDFFAGLPARFGKGGFVCDGCGKLTRQDYRRVFLPATGKDAKLLCRGCCKRVAVAEPGIVLK